MAKGKGSARRRLRVSNIIVNIWVSKGLARLDVIGVFYTN